MDFAVKESCLTLFAPAYMSISKDWGGERAHCAPLNILELVGVGVPILFGNDLLWNNLPVLIGLS